MQDTYLKEILGVFFHNDVIHSNDVKKVHRKFPLDMCLICFKFFPAISCHDSDWFLFCFTFSKLVNLKNSSNLLRLLIRIVYIYYHHCISFAIKMKRTNRIKYFVSCFRLRYFNVPLSNLFSIYLFSSSFV